jgi:CheY-like chemotaxis protein
MGLGLSIVRHLVEMHGGTVSANSAGKDLGSTFTVRLPLSPVYQVDRADGRIHPGAQDLASSAEPTDRLDEVRVLVVDDEEDTRELLEAGLAKCGANVTVAGSAAEGFELLSREKPDVVISDIGMPREDGYQFIQRVRELSSDRGGRVPAVALTAYARFEDRLKALRAGYQMHVPKPVELTELVAVISSLVQRTR